MAKYASDIIPDILIAGKEIGPVYFSPPPVKSVQTVLRCQIDNALLIKENIIHRIV